MGQFDPSAGFWVYHTQNESKKAGHANQVVDGVGSPAHESIYSPGAAWTIVLSNFFAKKHDPFSYDLFIIDSLEG
jgi:hypothetical protein